MKREPVWVDLFRLWLFKKMKESIDENGNIHKDDFIESVIDFVEEGFYPKPEKFLIPLREENEK